MYVSMKEILDHASRNCYAIPAPNCPDLNMARAAIEAARLEKSALIIDVSPRQMKLHAQAESYAALIKAMAEPLDVPIALNFDHGIEYADIVRCIKSGFSSVMCDASSLSFQDNISRVQQIVSLAHAHGASVEAELGHVGQAVDGDGIASNYYTDPKSAIKFVRDTQVDALAVAIGTAHGWYPKDYTPKLDFSRLCDLKKSLDNMPLVLHGASGSGDENLKKAVANGINKVNLWTEYSSTYVSGIREYLDQEERPDYLLLSLHAEEKATKWLRKYMQLFGSSNRYGF